MIAQRHRPLGKLPPVHDHAGIAIGKRALSAHLPVPPDHTAWPTAAWPMFLNDQLGCCAESAKALLALHWSRIAQAPIIWPEQAVERLYQTCGGYVPGQPATDRGTVMAFVNGFMCSTGIDIGLQAPEVWTLSIGLDHTDIDDICRAIAIFGAADIGWQLTRAMADSTNGRWDYVAGSPVVGGHDAILVNYRTIGGLREFTVATWSEEIIVTEACLRASIDEAWLGVSRQHWTRIDGQTPLLAFDDALSYASRLA